MVSMLHVENETVPGGFAEALAMDSEARIGLIINIVGKFLKESEAKLSADDVDLVQLAGAICHDQLLARPNDQHS